MKKTIYFFFTLCCLSVAAHSEPSARLLPPTTAVADDEYDMYRKKADEFFKTGRYAEARRYYQNCLEVPGFEKDEYATQRIELTTRCIVLLGQADEALQGQNDTLLVGTLKQVLALNATDMQVLTRLIEHYELKGNEQTNANQLANARLNYIQALDYAKTAGNRVKMSTLDVQIRNLDARLEQRETEQENRMRTTPRGGPVTVTRVEQPDLERVTVQVPVLKVGLGMAAIGIGLYAYSLKHDFDQKATALRQFEADNRLTELSEIGPPGLWNDYRKVREAAEAAQDKQGLYRLCVGVAAVAAIADVYLWVRKPKRRPIGFFWKPAPVGYGLAVGYQF
jgi:tetratricopeptide (TPR) repeat protein